MSKRKRSSFLLSDEPPDLHILVAEAPEPIPAHYDVLRLYSMCVQDLPRTNDGQPTSWDLRALVLEGESAPVAATVVRQWLDMVYSYVDAARQLRPFRSLHDAMPLLLFADATGTCDAAIRKLCDALTTPQGSAPRLDVPLGAQQVLSVEILLRGRLYRSAANEGLTYVDTNASADGAKTLAVAHSVFNPHRASFTSELCAQVESWLYLSSRLQMLPLVRMLLSFIKTQLLPGADSILGVEASAIYSPRVLQCMPRELLYESFLRDGLLYRPSDLRLQVSSGRVTATVLAPEPAAALRLEGVSSGLQPGGMVAGSGVQRSINRSRLVLEVPGGLGGGLGRSVPLNVCVGGLSAPICERLVRAAVQRAMDALGEGQ